MLVAPVSRVASQTVVSESATSVRAALIPGTTTVPLESASANSTLAEVPLRSTVKVGAPNGVVPLAFTRSVPPVIAISPAPPLRSKVADVAPLTGSMYANGWPVATGRVNCGIGWKPLMPVNETATA